MAAARHPARPSTRPSGPGRSPRRATPDSATACAAGLEEEGEIVVTLEVERINHDWRTAITEDFDTMASRDPEAAIWITVSRSDSHRVLEALNDRLEGLPQVEKTSGQSTAPLDFCLDAPGCTAIYTVEYVRGTLRAA